MNETLLEIKDLCVGYTSNRKIAKAVNGVSFSVQRGEVLGIVGETGAGKTSTALSILRLLPKFGAKITGQILFNGNDITQLDEKEMRTLRGRHISMIFQDPMTSLNPVFSVKEQIGRVIEIHNDHLGKGEVESKVEEILERVGIPPSRKNEYPHQFSGGMKQRVMIAIAIACNPDLLLADEPTSALDVTIQAQVIEMMRTLQHELNSATILITHDLGLVANFCDKVAIMYAGEIVEYGRLEDVFDDEAMHHPYTVGLFRAIPQITENTDRLSPIDGTIPHPTELPEGCKFHPRCAHCTEQCRTGAVPTVINGIHRVQCWLYTKEDVQ